ncbi:MAG TPA: 2-C-methyl-D-erythritol 4-phosphate cytidylyltransferase, partial [Pseudolabrys sp.]|nr:2-C-methyl-D-erythritol 4-phosphate cytidylyltransferase [Pseudolabrys sp.]
MSEVAAVVVAAGRGLRAGGEVPKQFRRIGGETMLSRTLSALLEVPRLAAVQPVIHPDDRDRYGAVGHDARILAPVFGGATRQASVRAGL